MSDFLSEYWLQYIAFEIPDTTEELFFALCEANSRLQLLCCERNGTHEISDLKEPVFVWSYILREHPFVAVSCRHGFVDEICDDSLATIEMTGTDPKIEGTVPVVGIGVAVLLCAFVAFFSFGPGVCVWVVAAELLPASVRAKGMSFALFGNQAVTAAIASVFLPVASRFGYAPLFFAFALAAAAYFALARRGF